MRALFVAACAAVLVASAVSATPLDDYVNMPDSSFNYTDLGIKHHGNGWTAHMYNVTSQTWLNSSYSDRSVWWHYMAIIIPHFINTSLTSGLLYITGQDDHVSNDFPGPLDAGLLVAATIAVQARSSAAVLWQVPNQPVTFPDDPFPGTQRVEDAAIAFTWWKYMTTPNPNPYWVLELPMTKAGVRALDVMQAVLPQYTGVNIDKFFVAGASKRGWTTWLVGAVDSRVIAILPIVLSALNVRAFAHRQFQFYGAWTFALQDYYKMNFTAMIDTPQFLNMSMFIDPWYYRQRLTMPKLALNAVGDEFQMPDDQRYWAHRLPGETNLLLVKNADHTMLTGIFEVLQGAGAFIQAVQSNTSRPQYSWSIDRASGNITVVTNTRPYSAKVAFAQSAAGVSLGRRDFRWAALNATPCQIKVFGACVRLILWEEKPATMINEFTYVASMPPPPKGFWTAFMLELQWSNTVGPDDFFFTSPASVIPNTMPFADCQGAACKGTLC